MKKQHAQGKLMDKRVYFELLSWGRVHNGGGNMVIGSERKNLIKHISSHIQEAERVNS